MKNGRIGHNATEKEALNSKNVVQIVHIPKSAPPIGAVHF